MKKELSSSDVGEGAELYQNDAWTQGYQLQGKIEQTWIISPGWVEDEGRPDKVYTMMRHCQGRHSAPFSQNGNIKYQIKFETDMQGKVFTQGDECLEHAAGGGVGGK